MENNFSEFASDDSSPLIGCSPILSDKTNRDRATLRHIKNNHISKEDKRDVKAIDKELSRPTKYYKWAIVLGIMAALFGAASAAFILVSLKSAPVIIAHAVEYTTLSDPLLMAIGCACAGFAALSIVGMVAAIAKGIGISHSEQYLDAKAAKLDGEEDALAASFTKI